MTQQCVEKCIIAFGVLDVLVYGLDIGKTKVGIIVWDKCLHCEETHPIDKSVR